MITLKLLRAVAPGRPDSMLSGWVVPIQDTCTRYEIDTPLRMACFLAQVAHESGGLKWVKELATGEAYEYRADLGNDKPGDGRRYKGRGLIQLTGKGNYQRCGQALGVSLVAYPELLEQPGYAALSAGWFWDDHHLNELADLDDMERITKRINGGLNGLEDRMSRHDAAIQYFESEGLL